MKGSGAGGPAFFGERERRRRDGEAGVETADIEGTVFSSPSGGLEGDGGSVFSIKERRALISPGLCRTELSTLMGTVFGIAAGSGSPPETVGVESTRASRTGPQAIVAAATATLVERLVKECVARDCEIPARSEAKAERDMAIGMTANVSERFVENVAAIRTEVEDRRAGLRRGSEAIVIVERVGVSGLTGHGCAGRIVGMKDGAPLMIGISVHTVVLPGGSIVVDMQH